MLIKSQKTKCLTFFSLLLLSQRLVFADLQEDGTPYPSMTKSVIWSTSFSNSEKEILEAIATDEGMMMYSIYEFDFNRDGHNEAIIVYVAGAHSSGAKVIKFDRGEYEIIFQHGSTTPNAQFKIVGGVATFIFEESDYNPDYVDGSRYIEKYVWDGKGFVKLKK